MPYAQSRYPQIQGINGKYSIASIGCFLTAFSNLESDYGNDIDPLALNGFFVNNGVYIDVDDQIRDDLGWDSITKYDERTRRSRMVDHGTNQTAGWPEINQAVVRFYYRSVQTQKMIFHFCKVSDAVNHLILDSYDGLVKKSPYGEPTAWAEYSHSEVPAPIVYYTSSPFTPKQIIINKDTHLWNLNGNPAAIELSMPKGGNPKTICATLHHVSSNTYFYAEKDDGYGYPVDDCSNYVPPEPPKPYVPPAAPVPIKLAPKITLVADVPAYREAADALHSTNKVGTLSAGEYFIHEVTKDMMNLSDHNMYEGLWINPKDNKEPEIVVPEVAPVEVIEKPVSTVLKPSEVPIGDDAHSTWKATYTAFNASGKGVKYKLNQQATMKEYSGKRNMVNLAASTEIVMLGTFLKNGVTFYRPRASNDEHFVWYYGVSLFDDDGKPNIVKVLPPTTTRKSWSELFRIWLDDLAKEQKIDSVWDIFVPFKYRK